MKLNIFIIMLLISVGVFAQVDRTKIPEPGPAPKISLKKPNEFTLKNGLTVLVVENHKLPRISYNLTIDNVPSVEGKKKGVSSLLAALLGNGTTSITKDDFNEEVDFLGVSLNFNSSGGYASGLSKYSERILQLMADATINPLFTEEELKKEKDKLIDGLKSQEKDVSAVAGRVALALAYGTHHPNGEFVTEESLNNVSLDDVRAFYNKSFNPENAYLAVIGDVDFIKIEQQVQKYFGSWKKATGIIDAKMPTESPNVESTQINFVDMPNAVQSSISVMNTTKFKMDNPDYHAVLIANHILGGGANGKLFKNLRVKNGYTYGSYSGINANKYVSRFRATAEVRNMVTDSSVVQILNEIERIRTEEVDSTILADAKAEYVGSFVLALENPQTVAQYALNIKINNLPEDFYSTYLQKINDVTIEDVKRVANTYFLPENSRIVIVGKGSDVLENLDKVTFKGKNVPINYYDKMVNPTEKSDYGADVPEGISAQTVIDNYIKAIGGKEKLLGVTSFALTAEAEIQGTKLNLDIKKTTNNQFMQDVKMMGNSVSKQVLNGNSGYVVMQGQRKDLDENEMNKIKPESAPFAELNYKSSDISLEGIEDIDGKKAYKIKISNDKFSFYDISTGLKLQDVTTVEMNGQSMSTTINYSDYQKVSGIMFPFLITQSIGPQKIDFIVKSIMVNEGVTDADFN